MPPKKHGQAASSAAAKSAATTRAPALPAGEPALEGMDASLLAADSHSSANALAGASASSGDPERYYDAATYNAKYGSNNDNGGALQLATGSLNGSAGGDGYSSLNASTAAEDYDDGEEEEDAHAKSGKLEGLPLTAAGMLVVYTVINLLSYFDRGALSGVLEDISLDFGGVSGAQRGLLGSAFMVGYMIASPIFAHLVTKFEPFRVMASGLFIWCLATLLCALAPSYWFVVLGRVLTGFGEASFLCIAPPFIDKFAPKGGKSLWLSVFYSAIPVGYALGFIASGVWLGAQPAGERWSWRIIFIAEAVLMFPFVLFSLAGKSPFSFADPASANAAAGAAGSARSDPETLAALQVEEGGAASPAGAPNGSGSGVSMAAGVAGESRKFLTAVKAILGNKLFYFVALGYAMQTFVTGGMAFFGIDYAKEELGLSKSTAGMGFGAVTVITGIVGTMLGGVVLDRLRARRGIPSATKKLVASEANPNNSEAVDGGLFDAHLETRPVDLLSPTPAGARAVTASGRAGRRLTAAERRAADERAQNDLQNPVNIRDRVESVLVSVKLVTVATAIAIVPAALAFILPGAPAFFVLLTVAELFLFCCFSPLNNCIMWTVPFALAPQALAFAVIFTHALGDALSPSIMGVMLDATGRKWRLVMLTMTVVLFAAVLFWGIAYFFARSLYVAIKHFPYSATGLSTSALAQRRKELGLRTTSNGMAVGVDGVPIASDSAIDNRQQGYATGAVVDVK